MREAPIGKVALLRIGPGAAATTPRAALEALYPRIVIGGVVVIEGCDAPERRQAVEEFLAGSGDRRPDRPHRLRRQSRGARTRPAKSPGGGGSVERSSRRAAVRADLPRRTRVDLSVIVVFYNMRREAARTLHSLSRSYQRGIDELAYEVIVVENGSAPDEVLGEEFVRSFGPSSAISISATGPRRHRSTRSTQGLELATRPDTSHS